MDFQAIGERASERQFESSRGTPFKRFMSLGLSHEYEGGGPCRAFTIRPTRTTEQLLQATGLLLRLRGDGLDVLKQVDETDSLGKLHRRLVRYLQQRHRPDGSSSRLTLVLDLQDEHFLTYTAMEPNVQLGEGALYYTNAAVHAPDGAGDAPAELVAPRVMLPIRPSNFKASVAGTSTVEIRSVTGRRILLAQRRPKDATRINTLIGPMVEHRMLFDGDSIEIAMFGWPDGRYRLVRIDEAGAATSEDFLYVSTPGTPLAVVDLFLAEPPAAASAGGQGAYPVQLGASIEAAVVTPRDYSISFSARKAIWSYTISRYGGRPAPHRLKIEGTADGPSFAEPVPVQLPSGAPAVRFESNAAHPLQRRSDVAPRLLAAATPDDPLYVLVDGLPTPSPESVRPPARATEPAAAEMHVLL